MSADKSPNASVPLHTNEKARVGNPISTVLKALILVAVLLRIPLLFRPDALFHTRPFIEDAYYTFSVARSVGHGEGFTVDGVHPTNGVQPLIVLAYAPLFALFPDDLALRLSLLLAMIIEGAMAMIVYRYLLMAATVHTGGEKARNTASLAVILLYWGYASTVYTLNGLETGLSVLLVFLVLLLYHRWIRKPPDVSFVRRTAVLGIVAGLMILSRIDTSFLVPILALDILFARVFPLGRRIVAALVFGLFAFVVSLPWWWYNLSQFGSLMPTSGVSQGMVVSYGENATAFIQFLINRLFIVGYLPYSVTLTTIHYCILIGIGILVLFLFSVHSLRRGMKEYLQAMSGYWNLTVWSPALYFIIALLVFYLFAFGAPHFLQRYLFIAHLLAVALAAILGMELWYRIRDRSRVMARIAAVSGISFLVGSFLYPYCWNYSRTKAAENDFYQASVWIGLHVEKGARVGMGQSGTAGFFHRNVVNLDGKVNLDVLSAIRDDGYCSYVRDSRFDYLMDWDPFFKRLERCDVLRDYMRIDSVGRFLVYKRIGGG